MAEGAASAFADEWVSRVSDDPHARLALLCRLYEVPTAADRGYLPFRRAAASFNGLAAAAGATEPRVRPATRQSVVAGAERIAAEGHLRSSGAGIWSPR